MSLNCNHDSLHFIYLAMEPERYALRQTAMYTLHYCIRTDLGFGHAANACRPLVIHILNAGEPEIMG